MAESQGLGEALKSIGIGEEAGTESEEALHKACVHE